MTVGCAASSDIAVHWKIAKLHIDEYRARIGNQMGHEGHKRLQVYKRRQDV